LSIPIPFPLIGLRLFLDWEASWPGPDGGVIAEPFLLSKARTSPFVAIDRAHHNKGWLN